METESQNKKDSLLLLITKEGVEAFLQSPFTKGIGKVFAKKITDRFGLQILNPNFDITQKLSEIEGLSSNRISEFEESLKELKVSPAILSFLYSTGLSDTEVEKIVSHYGKRLEKILLWDPYDMVENVWKLSFFTADKSGKFMNISPEDPRRLKGAILTSVKLYAEDGNMFATEDQTLKTASKITGTDIERIKPELQQLIEDKRIIKSYDGFYLPVYYNAEKEAAEKIISLLDKKEETSLPVTIPDKDIHGNLLSNDQKDAISTVLNNKVTIITGGPGTGKTTAVKGIISLLIDLNKKVVLTAPTGRAAKRISELTGEDAKTIHRLLGYSMGKGYRNKKLDTDILIIDEASMLEQVLFNHLLQAIKDDTKVVLIGDTDQLPAIGAGNVLKDMIDSRVIPVVTLTENFRQKDGSLISANAESIRKGVSPDKNPAKDFVLIEEKNSKSIHERLFSLISKEIPSYTAIEPKDIQVVTPQQEGPLGAKALNLELQENLNPDAPELKKGLKRFRLGDRVMQTTNSSERGIYNGEVGWISELDPDAKNLTVTFNDGKQSKYDAGQLKELSLAYATTVHKLQGSETDYMILLVTNAHKPMLYRNLLYTGVSRAKKLCVIVGEEKAIETAVASADKSVRNSNFKTRLQNVIEE